jgi:hypothetical protein
VTDLNSRIEEITTMSTILQTAADAGVTVTIITIDRGNAIGKLADAEIVFSTGPLAGLRLIGFSIWERRTGGGRNVTFPARQYSVNGERRSFALLRPTGDNAASMNVRDLILAAYEQQEAAWATDTRESNGLLPASPTTPPPATPPTTTAPLFS